MTTFDLHLKLLSGHFPRGTRSHVRGTHSNVNIQFWDLLQKLLNTGFDSRRYQIFWEVVGLERCRLNLVSTTEELLGRNSSCSDQENRDYGCGDPPRHSLCPQKLSLTLSTGGGRSVDIVRSRTKAMELLFNAEYPLVMSQTQSLKLTSIGCPFLVENQRTHQHCGGIEATEQD
jgi:hypothetical protein